MNFGRKEESFGWKFAKTQNIEENGKVGETRSRLRQSCYDRDKDQVTTNQLFPLIGNWFRLCSVLVKLNAYFNLPDMKSKV